MKRERERKREKEECMKSFTKVSPCSTFFFSLSALFPFCSALEHALIHLLNTPCGRILKRKKNGKGKLLFFFPLFCFLSFSLEWNHCALFMRSVEREIEREREREREREAGRKLISRSIVSPNLQLSSLSSLSSLSLWKIRFKPFSLGGIVAYVGIWFDAIPLPLRLRNEPYV